MLLSRKFKKFVGQPYDEDAIREVAARHGVRKTVANIVDVVAADDGRQHIKRKICEHYYTSLSLFNIVAREGYVTNMLKKGSPGLLAIYKGFGEADKSLENIENMTEQEAITAISNTVCLLEEALPALLVEMENALESIRRKLEQVLGRGYLYPWEHLQFKVMKNIQLPELPESQYKGKTLNMDVREGIVSSINLS